MHSFEIPKAILVESQPFSVENELLTPTFKLKRAVAKGKYTKALQDLYGTLGESSPI